MDATEGAVEILGVMRTSPEPTISPVRVRKPSISKVARPIASLSQVSVPAPLSRPRNWIEPRVACAFRYSAEGR